MWGIAAVVVTQVPLRLMSRVVSHSSSERSQEAEGWGDTPALATTKSSPPSSATPASTASRIPGRSRTSTSAVTHLRPSARTASAVARRSSGRAIG